MISHISSNTSTFIQLQGKKLVLGLPMLWGILFLAIPMFIIFKISLAESVYAKPPYTPFFSISEAGGFEILANFKNYFFIFSRTIEENLYIRAYMNSIQIAFVSTVLCLILGFPVAYYIAKSGLGKKNLLLMLVILPFWTSFLLRVYSWIGILNNKGVINSTLMKLGIIESPITMMHTNFAVYVGVVYAYLPFMILPLYINLSKLDNRLLEASADLGARPITTFFKITLVHAIPGIVAGSSLVFIPAVGEFVIPELLGGSSTLMIGRQLWTEFFAVRNWPVASALTTIMLFIIIIPIVLLQHRIDNDK